MKKGGTLDSWPSVIFLRLHIVDFQSFRQHPTYITINTERYPQTRGENFKSHCKLTCSTIRKSPNRSSGDTIISTKSRSKSKAEYLTWFRRSEDAIHSRVVCVKLTWERGVSCLRSTCGNERLAQTRRSADESAALWFQLLRFWSPFKLQNPSTFTNLQTLMCGCWTVTI